MRKNTAKQLDVLQRLSKFLKEKSRFLIFRSCIQSNFDYCPLVWHFCSKTNTEQLEKLQYRALRIIVFSDFTSSYAYLLEKAELSTLHLNRLRCIAAETYKCINNLTPEYISNLVQLKTSSYSFRYENTVKVPTVRSVTYGQCSLRFDSARVWNSLPNDIRKVTEFAEFRRQIRTWTGPSCRSAICRGSRG